MYYTTVPVIIGHEDEISTGIAEALAAKVVALAEVVAPLVVPAPNTVTSVGAGVVITQPE